MRNHNVITVVKGTTTRSVIAARVGLYRNSTTVTVTSVSAWTAMLTRPSWNSTASESMSLVIRVMITPAFSCV